MHERLITAAKAAYDKYGSKAAAARSLGIPITTFKDRLNKPLPATPAGRKETTLLDGVALIASDLHFWPGEPSTAYKAFILFCKKFRPAIVVLNGDVLDAAAISRHPPIGWNHQPSVKQEMEVAQVRLEEIAEAAPTAQKFWPLGNHDARFETRLATVAPEFKDVHGISLKDHFPAWEPCWSLFINDERGIVIKHRFKGGMHAPFNNTLWAGRSMVTGHLHSLKVNPITDYNGTRFGVDGGCLADPYHEAFNSYTEDNPKNWRSGFVLLTFKDGRLLWPEVVHVLEPGLVEFRGELNRGMNAGDFFTRLAEITKENLETARKKNADYADQEDPFKNFRAAERHGISVGQGLLVRMEDKMSRLGNLLKPGREAQVKESAVETAKDLANYASILAVWLENESK